MPRVEGWHPKVLFSMHAQLIEVITVMVFFSHRRLPELQPKLSWKVLQFSRLVGGGGGELQGLQWEGKIAETKKLY